MTRRNAHRDRNRRRFLAAVGAAAGAAVAGCLDGGEPDYQSGEVPNVDGGNRTAQQMAAAEALAVQEVQDGVSPLENLEIAAHEFVLEDGFVGPTVQGTVANEGGDRIELVEVRVRVYDADGNQLGRYLARTGDLDGGEEWAFTVVLLESPGDIAGYDVAVLGTPT